jgi:hypothetical protein
VTHGVDAAMHSVQPAGVEAKLDRSPPHAHRKELRTGHDAVLSCREAGDRTVPRMPATVTADPGPRGTFCIDALLK